MKTIGLVAPSLGISIEPYISRYNNAKKKFCELGYQIKEAKSIYGEGIVSNKAQIRAQEFMNMYLDKEVDFVFSVAGGELMMEILPYLDFKKLKKVNKLFIGYSDNTCLTFTMSTILGIKTIYGQNFSSFGANIWDLSLHDELALINGEKKRFFSYPKYQIIDNKNEDFLASFNNTEEVAYLGEMDLKGTILVGCIDVLVVLCGTEYDNVYNYVKDKKIIWFIDCCELNSYALIRALWQLRNAKWFTNAIGFVFGRCNTDSYIEAIHHALDDLSVPIVVNADIGHIPPTIPLRTGDIAHVVIKDKKGMIEYD